MQLDCNTQFFYCTLIYSARKKKPSAQLHHQQQQQWYACRSCEFFLFTEDKIIQEIGPGYFLIKHSEVRADFVVWSCNNKLMLRFFCPNCTRFLNVPICIALPYQELEILGGIIADDGEYQLFDREDYSHLQSYISSFDLTYALICKEDVVKFE